MDMCTEIAAAERVAVVVAQEAVGHTMPTEHILNTSSARSRSWHLAETAARSKRMTGRTGMMQVQMSRPVAMVATGGMAQETEAVGSVVAKAC
jgi:hypothetical protein